MSRTKVRKMLLKMIFILLGLMVAVPIAVMQLSGGLDGVTVGLLVGIGGLFGLIMLWMIMIMTQPERYPDKIPWALRRLPRQYIRLAEITSFQRMTSDELSRRVAAWQKEFPADRTISPASPSSH